MRYIKVSLKWTSRDSLARDIVPQFINGNLIRLIYEIFLGGSVKARFNSMYQETLSSFQSF